MYNEIAFQSHIASVCFQFDEQKSIWDECLSKLNNAPIPQFNHKCQIQIIGNTPACYFINHYLAGSTTDKVDNYGCTVIATKWLQSSNLSIAYAPNICKVEQRHYSEESSSMEPNYFGSDHEYIRKSTTLELCIVGGPEALKYGDLKQSSNRIIHASTTNSFAFESILELFVASVKHCFAQLLLAYKNCLLQFLAVRILVIFKNPSDTIRIEKSSDYAKNFPQYVNVTMQQYEEYGKKRLTHKVIYEAMLRLFAELCISHGNQYTLQPVANSTPIGPLKEVYENQHSKQKYLLKIIPFEPIENMEEIFRCFLFANWSKTRPYFAQIKGLYLLDTPNVEKQYYLVLDAGNYHQYQLSLALLKDKPAKMKTIHSLCNAIAAMHELGMAHKNLLPSRVFFSGDDLSLKLVGFENPRNVSAQSSSTFIRTRYSGPEVVHTRAASQVSDLFATGVMFWEIWYGQVTTTYTPQFIAGIDDSLKEIISMLMNNDETGRGTMQLCKAKLQLNYNI